MGMKNVWNFPDFFVEKTKTKLNTKLKFCKKETEII
jgi:hypothetical protein